MNYFVIPGITSPTSAKFILEYMNKQTKYNMFDKTKRQEVVEIRQITMYLLRNLTNESFAEIGKRFNKSHATVIHSCKTVDDLRTNKSYNKMYKPIFNFFNL